jgi:hypothetical protein
MLGSDDLPTKTSNAYNFRIWNSNETSFGASEPELGGYWFFVILMGVDIMDEYEIMEIRVYI